MIQGILVGLIFSSAVFYLGKLLYNQLQAKSACATGCGKCGVDFKKIENEIAKKNVNKLTHSS